MFVYIRNDKNQVGMIDITKEQLKEGLTAKAASDRATLYFARGSYDPRYHFVLDNSLELPLVENLQLVPLMHSSSN